MVAAEHHGVAELPHERFGMGMEVAKHFITPPSTNEFDVVDVNSSEK